MKTKPLLIIAAIFMLLHTLGHTMGALTWAEAPNAVLAAVITGMQSKYFSFMGREVTLGLFFSGYGFSMIIVLLYITVQLWLLACNPVKNMLIAMALLLSALAVIEYIYFFLMPALFTLIAAVCCWLALLKTPKEQLAAE